MHPRQDTIDGARKMLDFLEAHPEFDFSGEVKVLIYAQENAKLIALAKGMAPCEKKVQGDYLSFTRSFGGDAILEIFQDRAKVCERVVTGTKVIPAEPEKTVTIPAQKERVVEEFEWRCPESILALADPEEDEDDGPETPTVPPINEPAAIVG